MTAIDVLINPENWQTEYEYIEGYPTEYGELNYTGDNVLASARAELAALRKVAEAARKLIAGLDRFDDEVEPRADTDLSAALRELDEITKG